VVTATNRRGPGKTHYLPHNKISWSPPTVIFINTVTSPIPGAVPETLALAGWTATIVLRTKVKPGSWSRRTAHGNTARGLVNWLTDHTKGRETTWLFTHNAALDLITTRLPLELHAIGWEVNDASLSGAAPWVRLAYGSRRLCVVSSFSWLPHTAADLAVRMERPKVTRGESETSSDWAYRHARHDLDTVADAMLDLLDWWDKNELGKWSVSGPATGWHAMRHLPSYAR
jgi:hypothetical protein